MIWWFESPNRSKQEREDLDALAASVDWLVTRGWRIDQDLHLIWEADIVLADETFAFAMRYPNHFPYSPPLVIPRNPSERWSIHQYGSGELCLEYGPDNWRSELTGADMVRSAHRLLSTERSLSGESAEVPSRHETTIGQDLRGKYTRFLISREVEAVLRTLPESGCWTAEAVVFFHGESNVNVIATIDRGESGVWQENLPEPVRSGYSRQVVIARLSPQGTLPTARTLSEFREDFERHGIQLSQARFVVLLQGSEMRAYAVNETENKVFRVSVIPAPPEMARLDEEHERLLSLKVGIVGCGSLGSKIAASLVRAGVCRFLLVDHDILFPDNFVRHDLDWRDAGRHKADAVVASRIQMVNPGAVCEKRKEYLGGQESGGTTESLLEALGQCDLLIDATAEPAAFNYLSGASVISDKPLLWAEVFAGGVGGTIARHRPGIEPDPQSMRSAIENWWRQQGTPAERPVGRYQGGPEGAAIADDSDVTVIAAHAVRLAIDTLLVREPSIFPSSVYVIGLSKGLIFKQPFETYPIDVGGAPASADVEIDEAEQKAEVERLIDLLKEYKNADTAGPASG
jgi:hypothetical protein